MRGWWGHSRGDVRADAPAGGPLRRARRGFTIIELLTIVSIIAILMGILMPSLRGARDAARTAMCAATQRQLAQGLITYAANQDDWIPGYATSGRSLWFQPTPRHIAALSRFRHAPVQVNDWISPAVGADGLPTDRNERFYTLLERLADPAMDERVPAWVGGGDAGNLALADWISARKLPPARGISYLVSANFQLFGGAYDRITMLTPWSSGKLQELMRIHRIPETYQPRITMVGAPSRKVALADGFRYLELNYADFDASWSHQNWGSFSERSPCDIESRSWGRRGGGGTGFNIPLAYRHKARMNAAFFDGHVSPLSAAQSRDPVLWAPSKSLLRPALQNEPDAMAFGYDPRDPATSVIE